MKLDDFFGETPPSYERIFDQEQPPPPEKEEIQEPSSSTPWKQKLTGPLRIFSEWGRIIKKDCQSLKSHSWKMIPILAVAGFIKHTIIGAVTVFWGITQLTGISWLTRQAAKATIAATRALWNASSSPNRNAFTKYGLRALALIPGILSVATVTINSFTDRIAFKRAAEAAIFPSSSPLARAFMSRYGFNTEACQNRFMEWKQARSPYTFTPLSGYAHLEHIDGYIVKPDKPVKGVIVLQHGNGGCYEYQTDEADPYLAQGYAVVLYNRRGCNLSKGKLDEKTSIEDCENVLRAAKTFLDTPELDKEINAPIIIHGHSIGGLIGLSTLAKNLHSDEQEFRNVRIIADRTGRDIWSAIDNIVPRCLGIVSDLTKISSHVRFDHDEQLQQLHQEGRLFTIESAKIDREGELAVGDEIFGQGTVANRFGNIHHQEIIRDAIKGIRQRLLSDKEWQKFLATKPNAFSAGIWTIANARLAGQSKEMLLYYLKDELNRMNRLRYTPEGKKNIIIIKTALLMLNDLDNDTFSKLTPLRSPSSCINIGFNDAHNEGLSLASYQSIFKWIDPNFGTTRPRPDHPATAA